MTTLTHIINDPIISSPLVFDGRPTMRRMSWSASCDLKSPDGLAYLSVWVSRPAEKVQRGAACENPARGALEWKTSHAT
jgi:hypothetical protein